MKLDLNTTKTLRSLWLNEKEVLVYLAWLELWAASIQDLSEKSSVKRVTIYTYIDELKLKWFFSEVRRWNKRLFIAEAPSSLEAIMRKKNVELVKSQTELNDVSQNLPSVIDKLEGFYKKTWNVNRPNVRFYEWLEWIRAVLNDSLSSKETIYTYTNIEWINEYISDINEDYLIKRKKLKVHKKWLIIDSKQAREFVVDYDKTVTEIKFLKNVDFDVEMEIYDWKVSYLTFTDNKPIWVIIENKEIYHMHRSLFDFDWKRASN